MPLINCPECRKQVSDKAPTCPHCGNPIAGGSPDAPLHQIVVQQPPRPKSGCGSAFGWLIAIAAGVFLAFTNPTETDMRQKIAKDGWAPVGFERTNLLVLNWVSVTGFTGAKAKYLGIAGRIFKISGK
jgi:hypothetical protein